MNNSLFGKMQSVLMSQSDIKDICNTLKRGYYPLAVSGLSSIHKAQLALIISTLSEESAPLLIITDDEAGAKRICDDINEMCGASETAAYIYPAKDITLARVESVSKEYEYQRLCVLARLIDGSCKIVCASAEAVMQRTIPPDVLADRTIKLSRDTSVQLPDLISRLIAAGYTRCDKVESPSQFSVRGSIADIFPVQEKMPVRMELWDDEIDSFAYFDPETQRRTEQIDELIIPPAGEVLFNSADALIQKINALSAGVRGKRTELVRSNLAKDADNVSNGVSLANIDKYLPLAYDKPALIFDYLKPDSPVLFCEFHSCCEKAKAIQSQFNEDVKILLEEGELCRGLDGYIAEFESISETAVKFPCVLMDTFLRTNDIRCKKLWTMTAYQTAPWGGEIRQLSEDLRSFIDRNYSVIVLAGSEKTLPIIAEDLRNDGIPCDIMTEETTLTKGRVLITTGCLSSGYDYPDIKTALITQAKAMSSKRKLKKKKKGEEIKSLADIAPGDLVVHALHGIGRFEGIRKLELEGITKDYITIKYAGTDVLYVPVTQMDLISRYIGPRDDTGVKLNKLSSNEWQKTRSRVKKAVKDMADELIALYAKRSKTKGFAFSEDNDWQNDFEARFDYTETDDQLRCIEEIKQDMMKPTPMDRLLCGDVGFGKTEVAFRAAFKCMLDGKQCAVLVPTTVLAWQHYQSALKRFEHFPFKIELLSRFRTKKQQEEILKQVALGTVDMVIGTHRLVQKDVKFKDLGLAIIDEEQRFGVAHKERFKEAFTGVDVLTLSATPIPRTLNMAMSGIRDMSVIEEPPVDRYPVQTYVIEHNMGVIIQAINKELRRGGQVYYIHNRVETIDLCAAKIAELIPDARIAVAHGQLSEERLSDIWTELVDHEIDILVCTTIIETGVDVPNVNTLIIEDADNLGLSQLYQLRGRVGRSNRRAFAYFTFRRGKVLAEIASKRLDAIREFTQFGSGFRVAMRDLEIRGAGSILGGRQHGHMEAVGYDMYLQLLNEAIAEETGQTPPRTPEECLIDLQIEAHIPDDYIESLAGRLDAYRKIAAVSTKEESIDLLDEFIDRYGDPPKAIQGLVTVALTRNMAGKAGITEITQRSNALLIYVKTAGMEQVQALVKAFGGRVSVNGSADKPYIAIKLTKTDRPVEIMQTAVETFYEAGEQAKKTK
ncbi:transcription-repair coupling factor [Huintestinicola butyrica]|uniref:transcription-repair coupling factor n=1 Tax=Huintestinicola butyrica TaxID=2981728 RepID=UPI003F81861C